MICRVELYNIIRSCIKHNNFEELNEYSRDEISAGRLAEILAETITHRLIQDRLVDVDNGLLKMAQDLQRRGW
jgi:hypothetical protein